MTSFWHVLPSSGWERLAADAAWQSTAIVLGALLLARIVCRRPASRAAVLLAATAVSLAVPLASAAVRISGGGWLAPAGTVDTVLPMRSLAPAPEQSTAKSRPAASTVPGDPKGVLAKPVAEVALDPWPWLAGGWLALSGLLAFRLLRGVLVLRRWINRAEVCSEAAIRAALARAAEAIGVRPPEVLSSAAFDSPALVTLGRARLLLPVDMPKGVDWYAVFCHELAHLARRDNLGRVVVELATIALPWQPLMWLVRQKFRAACEEACDQWAVAAGVDPVDFASLLVEFVPERRPAFALGMAESPSAARQRILRLLAMQGPVHPRLGRLLGIAGWVAAVGLAITLAMLQISRGPRLTDPIKPELGAAGSAVGAPDDQAAPRRDEAELNTYISWTMPASQAGPRGDALPTFKAMPASGESPPWADTPLAEAIAKAAEALPKNTGRPAPYVIEPPDILLIDAVKLVPKAPYHIEPLDVLNITVANPLIDQPISGPFNVDPEGTINLGPPYGKVKVAGQTVDEALATIETHLKAALRDPQVAVYLSQTSGQQQIAGEHLVGPDGTVNLGSYGTVYVAGMTVAEAKDAVTALLTEYLEQPRVSLDVFSYNSKVYYIVVEGGDAGDHLLRAPITGNETVLDALALSTDGKIPNPAKCWVWVARPTPGQVLPELTLPVDLQAVLKGDTRSNWRIMPGDRIFLRPREKWGPALH